MGQAREGEFLDRMGLVACDPRSGACLGAFKDEPSADDIREIIARGVLVARKRLQDVSSGAHADCRVVAKGGCIARYMGRDIPAWIRTADGVLHEYEGVFAGGMRLTAMKAGLCMMEGLLFRRATGQGGS